MRYKLLMIQPEIPMIHCGHFAGTIERPVTQLKRPDKIPGRISP
jgi:hypothetical protein